MTTLSGRTVFPQWNEGVVTLAEINNFLQVEGIQLPQPVDRYDSPIHVLKEVMLHYMREWE